MVINLDKVALRATVLANEDIEIGHGAFRAVVKATVEAINKELHSPITVTTECGEVLG